MGVFDGKMGVFESKMVFSGVFDGKMGVFEVL
jgi:hypothetical protein